MKGTSQGKYLWIKFIVEEKYLSLRSLEVFKRITMTLIRRKQCESSGTSVKMDEMRRLYEIELDEYQSEVLEQSQKIIKEEMRVTLEQDSHTQVQIDEHNIFD